MLYVPRERTGRYNVMTKYIIKASIGAAYLYKDGDLYTTDLSRALWFDTQEEAEKYVRDNDRNNYVASVFQRDIEDEIK